MNLKNLFALATCALVTGPSILQAAPASKRKAKVVQTRPARPLKSVAAPATAQPMTVEQQRKYLEARQARARAIYIANQKFMAAVAIAGLSAEPMSNMKAPPKGQQPNGQQPNGQQPNAVQAPPKAQ
ncbi:hypothetical protein EON80_05620 [bacterium]|nr:MAG: hypothetical protein EON80_05620 [bacterium]